MTIDLDKIRAELQAIAQNATEIQEGVLVDEEAAGEILDSVLRIAALLDVKLDPVITEDGAQEIEGGS